MIQPRSFADSLQRSLLGLGDIGTALAKSDEDKARLGLVASQTQSQNLENQSKQLTFEQALRKKQLQDALAAAGPKPGNAQPMGDSGKASLGMDAAGMPTGLQGPGAAQQGLGGMQDSEAKLVSQLYQMDGQYDMSPDQVKAKHDSTLTTSRNAGTLSDLGVEGKRLENQGTGLSNSGIRQENRVRTVKANVAEGTQGAQIQDGLLAPKKSQAEIGLTNARTSNELAEADKNRALAQGKSLGGKIITGREAVDLGDSQSAMTQLGQLMQTAGNLEMWGNPLDKARALNPWDTNAKAFQQMVAATKQVIGKGLEGGVLRKEDETKYDKIIPQLGDTPDVLKAKYVQLHNMLAMKHNNTLEALGQAGYNVSQFKPAVPLSLSDLEAKAKSGSRGASGAWGDTSGGSSQKIKIGRFDVEAM